MTVEAMHGASSLIGARLADRFVVERRLGEGGMGIVYEALDVQRGERVALKTLDKMDGGSVYRLKKEFRALADLVHPNLVRLHELVSDDRLWFFTMARVTGVTFLEHVREDATLAEDPTISHEAATAASDTPVVSPLPSVVPLREAHLRSALAQLVEGVRAIHAAGKLHRDLKPGNVLVSSDGHVTILDFGLVEPLAPDATRSVAGAAGTPGYMAPEQLVEGGACPASDWYAVGTMLYESLTGRLPFTGSAMEVLSAKFTRREPVTVRALCPSAPADLAELAMELLRSKPSERPDAARIIALMGGATPALPSSAPRVRAAGRTPFVGREVELARLHHAFTQTRTGEPTIVLLAGLSGIGKSALVERFLDDVRGDGDAVVLSGRCYERESVPFKALDAVIDALSRYLGGLDRVAAARLTPRDVPELCRVFPVLARVPALAGTATARAAVPDPHEVRRRAFLALKEIFARIADGRPLVVTIDDLQWGDVDSGLLLTQLLSPPDPPRLLLVGSYRADEVERSELLKMLREHAKRTRDHVETLVLEPLDATNARDLATTLLRDRGVEPAPEVVAAIANEGGGSPFFISELARVDHEATAPSLPELLANRIAGLPPDARRLLELVSIAGRPVSRQVALRAAGLDTADDAGIPLLTSASLVRGSGAGEDASLETYHDRIRETVVGGLDADRASAHHLALAEVLAARPDPPAEQLARHYREGGRREEARVWTHRAADRAVDAMAFDRAAALYQHALDLVPEGDGERRRVETQLGDALANAGRGVEAAETYLRAASGASSAEVVELERRAACELMACGELDRGLKVMRRVAKRVGIWIPRSARLRRLIGLIGFLYFYVRGPRRKRSKRCSETALQRFDVAQSLGYAMALVDYTESFCLNGVVWRSSAMDGDTVRLASVLNLSCVCAAGLVGRANNRGVAWLQMLRDLADSTEEPRVRAYASCTAGAVAFVEGRWKAAHDACAEGDVLVGRCRGGVLDQGIMRTFGLWSLFLLGEIRLLSERAPVMAAEARARGHRVALSVAVTTYSTAGRLARDEVETATREADEAIGSWPGRGVQLQHLMYLLARGLIDLYSGTGTQFHERFERDWPALQGAGLFAVKIGLQQALHLRAGAALAAAGDERGANERDGKRSSALLDAAERHARKLEGIPLPGSVPLAALVHAGVAHTRGESARAAELLVAAAKDFDEADMKMHAVAARRQLGRVRGGEEGAKLVDEADAAMRKEAIVRPDRFAAMLAPGFPD